MTIAILVAAAALSGLLIFLGFRRAQALHPGPTNAEIIDWSRRFGVEASSQRFSLPVKAVRRLRVVSGDERKSCASCENFALEKGQLAIRSHSIMAQVTKALPPAIIGKNPSSTESWDEFGACLKRPGVILGANDWCGKPEWKGGPEDLWS